MNKFEKRPILAESAPRHVGPYSQGLIVGPFIYVSGQGPLDPATGDIVPGTIEEETMLTFHNIEAILQASGASLEDVVKVNAYLQDIGQFDRFSATYAKIFASSPILPTRTTVGAGLVGIKVEADVIAIAPHYSGS